MKNKLKNCRLYQVFLGIIIGSLVFSLGSFLFHANKVRKVCLFRSYDSNKICSEIRYYPKMNKVQAVKIFTEDLLLGPFTNRYKSILSKETKVEFCFAEDKILYIGLSSEALKTDNEITDIRSSIDLIRKNIVKNFTSFNKICIFIDGVEVS